MPRYRKLPVVVDAEKVERDEVVTTVDGNTVTIPAGAYRVIDGKGFPYPCDAEIFESTHELVED
jgi:hypothetical protein